MINHQDENIIVSIQHTGTQFLGKRLGTENMVHTDMPWDLVQRKLEGKKIYSPLRHPSKVWQSWANRFAPGPAFPHIAFAWQWYAMDIIDTLYDVDFINLETQDDPRIKDWSPVNHYGGKRHSFEPPPHDLKRLYRLPFVLRHFGEYRP